MPSQSSAQAMEFAPIDFRSQAPSSCPACGGPVLELRSGSRCVRCQFTLCETCDGESRDFCPHITATGSQ